MQYLDKSLKLVIRCYENNKNSSTFNAFWIYILVICIKTKSQYVSYYLEFIINFNYICLIFNIFRAIFLIKFSEGNYSQTFI